MFTLKHCFVTHLLQIEILQISFLQIYSSERGGWSGGLCYWAWSLNVLFVGFLLFENKSFNIPYVFLGLWSLDIFVVGLIPTSDLTTKKQTGLISNSTWNEKFELF